MLIIGIDPGQKGAICEYYEDQDKIVLHRMDYDLFRELASKWRTLFPKIYLEKAQAMPKQGVTGMFSYGRHFGQMEGVLDAYSLSYELVAPTVWTAKMTRHHQGETGKERAYNAVKFLFPNVNLLATKRSTKPHDGFIDALLIAEYGKRKINNDF